jgi:hypothetical protein
MEAKKDQEIKISDGTGLSLLFVSIIFLLRAGYYAFLFLSNFGLYIPYDHQVFALGFLILSLLYLVTVLGFYKRRYFSYSMAWFLLSIDIILSIGYIFNPIAALIGIPLTLLMIYLLRRGEKYLTRKSDKDKYTIPALIALVVLYFAIFSYSGSMPDPEPFSSQVTREAIEKNDVKICDKIKSGYGDDCIRSFAESKKDSKICKLISWEHDRNRCYLHIASDIKNPEICALITEDYERGMCNDNTKT